MMAGERNIDCFDEILLCESGTPCWVIIAGLFGRIVKYSGELLELIIAEFGRTSGPGIIVERGFEVALFEAVQPVVDGLVVPPVLVFDLFWRESLQILTCGSKTLNRLWIGLVRELLADSFLRDTGNLVPCLVIPRLLAENYRDFRPAV